ncbi:MAG: VanZ family protein, partial [Flavobacteriales bacterium]|nr:VanZ family protein [Flavobacteriales bacterium]
SFLSVLGFSKQPNSFLLSNKLQFFFSISFSIIMGGLIEVLQEYVFINRYGDWYDFIANSLGAIIGVIGFYSMRKFFVNRLQ